MKADVTEFDQVKEMMEKTFAQYGKIDILVNNVGLIRDNFLMLMSDDDWDSLLKTNLTSLFYCCKTVIRKMIPQRSGKIINISSVSGILGTSGQTNYAATKGGMISFTKSLARELGPFHIHVNAVAPGLIESEIVSKMPREKVEAITQINLSGPDGETGGGGKGRPFSCFRCIGLYHGPDPHRGWRNRLNPMRNADFGMRNQKNQQCSKKEIASLRSQ